MAAPEHTLIVVDNVNEQRVYYSVATATNGILGYLARPGLWGRSQRHGQVRVYRLDEEATEIATAEAQRALAADPTVWTGTTMTSGHTAKKNIRNMLRRLWK